MDFFRIWPFVGDSISHPVVNARYLRLLFEVVDEVEDGVFQWQIDRLPLWENPLHLNVKVVPFFFAPEVVDHDEATSLKVLTHGKDLGVAEPDESRFNHVHERIVENFGISQVKVEGLRVNIHGGQLL